VTGTCPLVDHDGSKRAAMAASLEYGTHPIVGQHLYRVATAPVFPRCGICGKQRVLYQGVCGTCGDREDREDNR
jgi:hypothetical protein